MNEIVLITGGTGLVGSRLTELLQEKGYKIRYLSRSPGKVKDVEAFVWDVEKQTIDIKAFDGVSYIIHLAGAGVADEKWTPARKKVILESRTRSTALLKDALRDYPNNVKAVISASAIGYYGFDNGDRWQVEGSRFGDDFLATVTKAWEAEADLIRELGIRVVKVRVGVVLSENGGALKEMGKPVKLGLGAPLGSGDQYMSWIHIDDLCNIFIYAMENENMSGSYNGVAPHPVTNRDLTKSIAKEMGKPFFLPAVPSFALKLALGQMAGLLLGSSRVSSERIESEGFKFKYPEIKGALHNLLEN
ncbi:TIGR01777 family oxidoreductase [Fulvivirga sp. 29W222]|uniref:TIGR01777 family oxidoreductase n=1 Tax=Fulvivirga marina TaxID=2494733 RepID=A0A937FYW2_9BACT|nr:TIGR01777 family oxidoreductase [Fulvivirga marina]MBL6447547.1 TIGR01777 family oxidoreductase [Fulvivirga marina]